MNEWVLSELERMQANMIRVGTVAELDQSAGMITVDVAGLVTDWIPWLTARAGATRTWSAPRPGEQVLVLSPYGDLSQAVALPAIYQRKYPAPAGTQDVERVIFPDGSMAEYDSAGHALTVTVGSGNVTINCGTATVNAGQSVTLNSPQTTCTGALTVQGHLTYQAGMTGSAGASIAGNVAISGGISNNGTNIGAGHVHSGVESGLKLSGPPQ